MRAHLAWGRFALGLVFLVSGLSKLVNYSSVHQSLLAEGVLWPSLSLPIALTVEIAGSLLLILGYRTKTVAALLALYLIPVTWVFHPFWEKTGIARQQELTQFLKNLSILGGLTLTYAYQRILDSFTAGTLSNIRRDTYEKRKAA